MTAHSDDLWRVSDLHQRHTRPLSSTLPHLTVLVRWFPYLLTMVKKKSYLTILALDSFLGDGKTQGKESV
jgi:hypothetical protein